MRPVAVFGLAALALCLAGCMVGPKYTPPQVPVAPADRGQLPAAYKEAGGWKQAQPGDPVLPQDWWQVFGNSELNNLETEVDASNQAVKSAEAAFREARAAVGLNRANLYPTISTAPNISTNMASRNNPQGSQTNGEYSNLVLPFDLSYEVDAWGRIRRSIAAARQEAQASAADLATIRLSIHAELAIDYFEMRSLDAQQQLLDRTLVAFQKALDLNQNRFAGGLSSGAEVAQAQTQLESTRAQSIEVGVERAQFEHAIAVLAGRTPESLSLPQAPLASTPPPIPTGVPSQLLERRPDIAGAERRVAEANQQIGIAQAAFFPTLLLTATGGYQAGSIVDWFNWPSRFWALGPNALQTLFDAGRRRAASQQATAAYDVTVANYRQTALEAFREVDDALSALRILERESAAQRVAVEAAQHSLDLSMNRYTGGLVTYLEVVTAQSIALSNQRIEVDLLRRRMDACVLLIKALGGGWDVSRLPS